MQITANNLGKRYNREWIFRHFTYQFLPTKKYAVTGPNGSGKSTLLQVIAGAVLHSEGNIQFAHEKEIPAENMYQQLSFASPYLELVEEMTATELLGFHSRFKPLDKTIPNILEAVSLSAAANKQIRYFSSGMKQRLKLAQAFFSSAPILLLDEPTTNLDTDGINLYQQLIKNNTHNKLVIISSNDNLEYNFCDEVIAISDYK